MRNLNEEWQAFKEKVGEDFAWLRTGIEKLRNEVNEKN